MKNSYKKYSYKLSNYLLSPTSLLYYKIPENKFFVSPKYPYFSYQ